MNVTFWSVGLICPYCRSVLRDNGEFFSHLLDFHVLGRANDIADSFLLNLLTRAQVSNENILNSVHQGVRSVLATYLYFTDMLLSRNNSSGWFADFTDYKSQISRSPMPDWCSHVAALTPSSITDPICNVFQFPPCWQRGSSAPTSSVVAVKDEAISPPAHPHPLAENPTSTNFSRDIWLKVSKSNHSLKEWPVISQAQAELAASALTVNIMKMPSETTRNLWKAALKSVKIMISHRKDQVLRRLCSRCQVVYTSNDYQNPHHCHARKAKSHRKNMRKNRHPSAHRCVIQNGLNHRISAYRTRRQVRGRSK